MKRARTRRATPWATLVPPPLRGSDAAFLGRGIGGSDYARDRPAEFAEKGAGAPRRLRCTRSIECAGRAGPRLLADLSRTACSDAPEAGGTRRTRWATYRAPRRPRHWSLHTGQIVFDVKARKPGAFFDELWMKVMEKR